MIRLGTKTGGTSQFPTGTDQPISIRGAVSAGDVRYYQAWYRNLAAFCQPEGFNLTNGLRITWAP